MKDTKAAHEVVHDTGLKRTMGSWGVLGMGVGAMVGFGWVVLAGGWITSAGPFGAATAMICGGLMMALIALIYAEMVAAMPHAGGEHNYIIRGLGPRWSMIGSWAITGGYTMVIAFEAVALPKALNYVVDLNHIKLWEVGGAPVYLVWVLVGSLTAVAITVINILGVKLASGVQLFVVLFLFLIGTFQVIGIFVGGNAQNLEPGFHGGAAGFFTVLLIVPFMFVGFDVIPQTAEEVDLPPRRIGQLSVASVLIATAWYVAIILFIGFSLSRADVANSQLPAVDAMAAAWGSQFAANAVVAAGLAGILTSWNSLQMGASRLVFSLARGGMIPAWFGRLHPKFGTPANALIALGACTVLAPLLGNVAIGWIADASSPMIVMAYLLVCITFVVLRKREPGMERPLRIGGKGNFGLVLGWLSIAVTAFLVALYVPGMPAQISWQSWLIFGGWWLVGIVFLLRIPGGVKPGEFAERDLLAIIEKRRSKR
ncbi:MAG: APC family permease [Microbacteriaceae bacterium]|nr:APC family permease [Microbacteriaceae bacterium]